MLRDLFQKLGLLTVGVVALVACSHQASAQGHGYATDAYYSPKLRASFVVEQMTINGSSFWGARLTGLQPGSPLTPLNLQLGDVITRLDGIRVSTGMYQTNNTLGGSPIWALPQMEKHFGSTAVRMIRSNSNFVQELTIDLGPPNNLLGGGGGVVVP